MFSQGDFLKILASVVGKEERYLLPSNDLQYLEFAILCSKYWLFGGHQKLQKSWHISILCTFVYSCSALPRPARCALACPSGRDTSRRVITPKDNCISSRDFVMKYRVRNRSPSNFRSNFRYRQKWIFEILANYGLSCLSKPLFCKHQVAMLRNRAFTRCQATVSMTWNLRPSDRKYLFVAGA